MRILFMGTPDFAVPSLSALIQAGHDICGVFTQPDKPKNRGMKLQAPPVKELALTHNIPVFQPVKLRDGTALAQIAALNPELIVVAAYGRILPNEILDFPKNGCINVHSSLLPKYRGSAPIHWAVVNGDDETGVTIMHMAEELDAGDIIAQRTTAIHPMENVEAVYNRLSDMGGELLVEVVASIADGTATRTPQDHSQMTLAPMLSRELCPLDWNRSAWELHNQIRGLNPWPATTMTLPNGESLKVYAAAPSEEKSDAPAGQIISGDKLGIAVVCGDGAILRLTEVQAQGSRRMAAADYLRGHPIQLD